MINFEDKEISKAINILDSISDKLRFTKRRNWQWIRY